MTTKMTTTKTMKTTTKTLTALALAAAALTVMVGSSEAAPRFQKFGAVISCFTCNLPHGGPQGGARPPGYHGPGYGWGYGNHWPYHGWGYGNHWPYHGWGYGYGSWPYYGWGYGYRWPYYGWGYGYGNHWGYGHYRWHPMYGSAPAAAAPVAAAPVAAAPVATAAAPSAPTGGPNCLTRQMLPNGAELLQDVCTQESAIAQPQALSAR